MIVSVPFCAPLTPPDTGASTIRTPCVARSATSSRVCSGSDELMSMTIGALGQCVAQPVLDQHGTHDGGVRQHQDHRVGLAQFGDLRDDAAAVAGQPLPGGRLGSRTR